jgi:5-bromo-4-chloroindolyl phosphate hydrolysis protein
MNNKKWTKEKCHKVALNYKSRIDFQRNSPSAYQIARKNGWLNEICQHINRPPYISHKKWTKEKCHEVALKCKNRTEFNEKYGGAYEVARVNSWLDEVTTHIPPTKKWNKENCIKIALSCKTRKEFREKYNHAYQVVRINGWSDELYSQMTMVKGTKGYWTKEKCHQIALKYTTRMDIIKHDRDCYTYIMINGLSRELFSHFIETTKKPYGYWNNFENCKEAASHYNSITELCRKNSHVYKVARKNNWLHIFYPNAIKRNRNKVLINIVFE